MLPDAIRAQHRRTEVKRIPFDSITKEDAHILPIPSKINLNTA